MKYFFEIENLQKYFGFIFKQGSNASTKSMHPTPVVCSYLLIFDLVLFTSPEDGGHTFF
jgi:DNA gyrase inhibitor GyrI